MPTRAQYTPGTGAEELETFFDSVVAQAQDANIGKVNAVAAALDSAANESGVSLPVAVQNLIGQMKDADQRIVLDAVMDGIEVYRREHGVAPTGDVIEAALSQGMAGAREPRSLLDSAGSTGHHDQLSTQPNRIVVAVTSAIAEAIPFATYLPTDIGSNEAKLGIVSHASGSAFGDYALNELLDGVNIGKEFFSSERMLQLSVNGGGASGTPLTGQFLTTAGGTGVPVLRYRTYITVDGRPVAFESTQNSSGSTSSISGVVNIGGTDYALAGAITIATGAITLTNTPALPANTVVFAHGFIDYEANPALTPEVITSVQTYSLFASPWRGKAKQTVDSKTQYTNEIGMDLLSESVISMRNQAANERHYRVLAQALRLARTKTYAFDFDRTAQIAQKDRRQIWLNLFPVLGTASQTMAEDTMDHGITHLYVGKNIASDFRGLPSDIWEPSGLTDRPGIFRLGRLFNTYEVYYTPKILLQTGNSGQILCIGRSTQVARCPFVLGDAVPPMFMPLAFNDDLKQGTAFYGRNFTNVNPHIPSSYGVALINVTNL